MDTTARIVAVPSDYPDKWDLADKLPPSYRQGDGRRLLAEATPFVSPQPQEQEWPEPTPLMREPDAQQSFPLEALPPVAHAAATAMAAAFEAHPILTGQCCVAALVSACQAHADVFNPREGKVKPTSQDFLLVGYSGDRKTTTDEAAFSAFTQYEAFLGARYADELKAYEIEKETFERTRKATVAKNGDSRAAHRKAVMDAGEAPREPIGPAILCSEPTFEGLTRQLIQHQPHAVIASSEGGAFLNGWAMKSENRVNTLGGISRLWDKGELKRTRGSEIYATGGKRLSIHLLAQPETVNELLSDKVARSQGLFSRLNIAWVPSLDRTGTAKTTAAQRELMDDFQAQLLSALKRELPLDDSAAGVGGLRLKPRVYRLSDPAEQLWDSFVVEVETALNRGARLAEWRDMANKAPEIALRFAGTFACFENGPDFKEITAEQMGRAITLSRWYLDEKVRIFNADIADPDTVTTWGLLRKFADRGMEQVEVRLLERAGFAGCATAAKTRTRLYKLADEHWLRPLDGQTQGKASIFLVRPDLMVRLDSLEREQPDKPDKPDKSIPEPDLVGYVGSVGCLRDSESWDGERTTAENKTAQPTSEPNQFAEFMADEPPMPALRVFPRRGRL